MAIRISIRRYNKRLFRFSETRLGDYDTKTPNGQDGFLSPHFPSRCVICGRKSEARWREPVSSLLFNRAPQPRSLLSSPACCAAFRTSVRDAASSLRRHLAFSSTGPTARAADRRYSAVWPSPVFTSQPDWVNASSMRRIASRSGRHEFHEANHFGNLYNEQYFPGL
jgi:hypothetical protein